MTTLQYMQKIRRILKEDRAALWHGHANMATGKVEDAAAREALQEYDQCIAWLNTTIHTMQVQP